MEVGAEWRDDPSAKIFGTSWEWCLRCAHIESQSHVCRSQVIKMSTRAIQRELESRNEFGFKYTRYFWWYALRLCRIQSDTPEDINQRICRSPVTSCIAHSLRLYADARNPTRNVERKRALFHDIIVITLCLSRIPILYTIRRRLAGSSCRSTRRTCHLPTTSCLAYAPSRYKHA